MFVHNPQAQANVIQFSSSKRRRKKAKQKQTEGKRVFLKVVSRAVFFPRLEQNPVSINISKVSHSFGYWLLLPLAIIVIIISTKSRVCCCFSAFSFLFLRTASALWCTTNFHVLLLRLPCVLQIFGEPRG
jgi:VanZ family protein